MCDIDQCVYCVCVCILYFVGLVPGYSFNWTVPCAKMMMFLNLATAFCLRKEFDKARRSLQQVVMLFCMDTE